VNRHMAATITRKTVLLGLSTALAMFLAACGGGSSVHVSLSTPPPATVTTNQTPLIAASVTNDSSNSGVDWSCTPAASCGTFTPAHTASGATTVYQAADSAGSVTITAASTKDPNKTASSTVTVAAPSVSALKGTYTFVAEGLNTNYDPSNVVGSIVLDGNGNITGGEQDRSDSDAGVFGADTIANGGTITMGSDGRGTITLTANSWGSETFSISWVNNNHLLITEFDGNATSAGSMDLQTAVTSFPDGSYAFSLGESPDTYFSFGGVITTQGTNVTGGDADDNYDGNSPDFDFDPGLAAAITQPDAAGRGVILLYDYYYDANLEFAYYVVGPEAFRLVEIDEIDYLAGSMFGQGTAAGTYSAASLNGSFVFSQNGWTNPAWFAVAGQFTADGTGTFTAGQMDVNDGSDAPYLAADISGSGYGFATDGYGSIALSPTNGSYLANFGIYLVDPAINIADPNSPLGGGGALLTDLDDTTTSAGDGSGPGIGFAAPQSTTATAAFSGNYAFSQDGYGDVVSGDNYDLIGQVNSDGSSNLTGTVDLNDLGTAQYSGLPLTATFAADGSHPGRYTAPVSVNGSTTADDLTLYQASGNLVLHVDVTNANNIAIGAFEK
jgi:hypothetical protein